jgi:ATP-dependent DNA ligase
MAPMRDFSGISYTSDTLKIFDRFGGEIWDMAGQDAADMGCKNICEMIAGFNRSDSVRVGSHAHAAFSQGAIAMRNDGTITSVDPLRRSMKRVKHAGQQIIRPMEAKGVAALPEGVDWVYEPKWDGFRCLALKDGNDVVLQGKSGKPLGRYFPEVVEAIASIELKRLALDGEILIRTGGELSFDALQMRLHPAESRITKLSMETPALFAAFDTLVSERGKSINAEPFAQRRTVLENISAAFKHEQVGLTEQTADIKAAQGWLENGFAGTDGVVAKRTDLDYRFGERAMVKVKRIRTADCVVGGFRYAQDSELVGSLLLGLYNDKGLLDHVGFTSAFAKEDKHALTARLEKLVEPPGFTGDAPGGPSRWATERSTEWRPLKTKLVVEVSFDHVTGGRFRHGTRLLRWRPDKAPKQCTMVQIS